MFQSTHPHGVRHWVSKFFFAVNSFNPRTHMGCDALVRCHHRGCAVSIHAPTWGATGHDLYLFFKVVVSIHAPTWGATSLSFNNFDTKLVSIHAPTWGATR